MAFPFWLYNSSRTFVSSIGYESRIDFVLLPERWKDFQVNSCVSEDIDLAIWRHDHFAPVVTVHMESQQSGQAFHKRCRLDLRKIGDPAAQHKFLSQVQRCPPISWQVGVGEHLDIVTRHVQSCAQNAFAVDRTLPRQRYMSDATWHTVQTRKTLLRMHDRAIKLLTRQRKHYHFAYWLGRFAAIRKEPRLFHMASARLSNSTMISCMLRKQALWALVTRRRLHAVTQAMSRQDRIREAHQIGERFLNAAHSQSSKEMYRALRPLMGQVHRKANMQFRPVPAVKLASGELAQTHAQAQERWRAFFAAPEEGILVTSSQLQTLAKLQALRHEPGAVAFARQALPMLHEIEQVLLRSKPGKTPGMDGLPGEVFRLHPPFFAQLLWPLLAKCSVRCTEPLRWRGGEICPLPKSHVISHQVERYRSILLADVTAKVAHGVLRNKLLPYFMRFRASMQAGGVPRLSTDMLQLFVSSFSRWTRDRKCSSSTVFLDVQQAFYKALRPLLLHQTISDSCVVRLFHDNHWNPELLQDFRQFLDGCPALSQANVPEHLQAQLHAVLSTTWFKLRNDDSSLTATLTGTRPGDSLADLLYGFLMGRFIRELEARLTAADLCAKVPLHWLPGASLSGDDHHVSLVQVTWVDDISLVLEAQSPNSLLTKVRLALSISLRGPHSQTVWRSLLAQDGGLPSVAFHCPVLLQPACVSILPDYVHLGTLQDQSGTPAAEVKRRMQLVRPAMRMLQRGIFRSNRMPAKTRLTLFRSLVLSKLTYGAGGWSEMHLHTLRSWHTGMMRLLSAVAPTARRGPGTRTLDVLADCNTIPPLMHLMQHRLSLFDRLMLTDTFDELFALLQQQPADSGWFAQVKSDLRRLVCLHPHADIAKVVDQGDYALASHSSSHPKVLTKFFKQACSIYALYLGLWQDLRSFQRHFRQDVEALGGRFAPGSLPSHMPGLFVCQDCERTFDTFRAMCSHMFQQHRSVNLAQRYTASNHCRACLRMYNDRASVVHHLKYYRTGCLLKLLLSVAPLNDEELTAVLDDHSQQLRTARSKMRRTHHRFPVCSAQGPLRPWPWDLAWHQATHDKRPIDVEILAHLSPWVEQLSACLDELNHAKLLECLMQRPFHGALVQALSTELFHHERVPPIDQVEARAMFHEAVVLWQSSSLLDGPFRCWKISFDTVRPQLTSLRPTMLTQENTTATLHGRRRMAVDALWQETDVSFQMGLLVQEESAGTWSWPTTVPRPLSELAIFLYVFSGRRREGDYQSHVERLLRVHGVSGRVLMIDLALSASHNVYDSALVETLLHWIHAGAVATLLVAPPCETWSEARNQTGGPRPLRTRAAPFAIAGLTHKELEQLQVSNFLLFVAVRLFLWAVMCGLPGVMEHPRQPRKSDRCSIWTLPWLQGLVQHDQVRLELIWQAAFGAVAAKPTHLLVSHMPLFRHHIRALQQPIRWQELEILQGRDSSGAWRTAKAKEYPSKLNEALALAQVLSVKTSARPRLQMSDEDAAAISTMYEALARYDEETTMQPDFMGHAAPR